MVVVQDKDEIVRDGGDFIEQVCQAAIQLAVAEGIGVQPISLLQSSVQSLRFTQAIVCKAATRYVRKRVGSLSPSSSDSQATGLLAVWQPIR